MVFYRKYRPQTLEELDSKEVREKLYSALSSESVSHAFLFTGPKGLGKTSAARIVAKILNCECLNGKNKKTGQAPKPCNKCYQCVSIGNGTNIDVLEIDGASNRGIDEIRDLREKVKLSPAKAFKKIYILDEVHMLTTEAFNALLKTLEEPPSHVVFILCTTEPHKVPPTIVSRCLHIAFRKATSDELIHSFKRIAKSENLEIEDDALSLIAGFSDGSFRDGVKILEEISLLVKNKKITKELVEEKYRITEIRNQISLMLGYLADKKIGEALKLISDLTENGIDMKYFIEQLIASLHAILLNKVGIKSDAELPFVLSKSDRAEFSVKEAKELMEILARAYGELKYAVLIQLPLELAVIEWGLSGRETVVSQTVADIGFDKKGDKPVLEGGNPQLWKNFIEKVNLLNRSVAGVLRGCSLKSFDGNKLTIEAKFKFHKERLDDEKSREIIEKVFGEIVGNKIQSLIVMKEVN